MQPKQRGLIFMVWGVLMFAVQVLRGQAPNAAPMSLQYRVVALLIPTAVFGFGLYRYRSASKP